MGSVSNTRRGLWRRDAPRRCPDAGFTLVEVMAAMVVFIVISTATVTVVIQGLRTMRENSDRAVAANIARDEIEYLRSVGTAGINPGVTLDGHAAAVNSDFKVRTTATWVGFNQSGDSCAASVPGKDYMRVTVQVTSSNITDPQTIDTLITPPPNAATPSLGQVRINVNDQLGMPVSDVTVTGIPPTTLLTGAGGCVFVPDLKPASLNVSISKNGYVTDTPTGLSKTATITAGTLTKKDFNLAAASSIQFSASNSDYPTPSVMPVMWQLNDTSSLAVASTVGSTITNRWPLKTGFVAWAGSCTDANPLTSYGVSPQGFPFTAGQTTIAALNTGLVRLRGLPKNEAVTANYAGPDGACGQAPVLLGTSNNLGILKVGLPYGKWSFTAKTQTQDLATPLAPPAAGSPAEVVVVNFTLACLDNPSPIPQGAPCEVKGSGSPSGSPSGSGSAAPSFEPTTEPSALPSPSP
jgi:prepilin-type N-terminal cleavage/methylation domain-containing protein